MRRLTMLALCAMTGCASIVSGTNQPLSVVTRDAQGVDAPGAKCTLTNDKGLWYTSTPGSVTVRRSYSDLMVNCALAGASPESLSVKSSTKGMAFGNILFGGIIGVGVDVGTGAAYDYPDVIEFSFKGTPSNGAPPTPSAASVPPSSASAAPTRIADEPAGRDAYQVERLPETRACHAQPRPNLTAKGPGFETYTVACTGGDALIVRCEFGNCRALR